MYGEVSVSPTNTVEKTYSFIIIVISMFMATLIFKSKGYKVGLNYCRIIERNIGLSVVDSWFGCLYPEVSLSHEIGQSFSVRNLKKKKKTIVCVYGVSII